MFILLPKEGAQSTDCGYNLNFSYLPEINYIYQELTESSYGMKTQGKGEVKVPFKRRYQERIDYVAVREDAPTWTLLYNSL